MNKFRIWYTTHQDAISWFLIGLLTGQCIEQLARGDLGGAALSGAIAAANYFLVSYKLKV